MTENIIFELMKNLKTILLLFLAIPSIGISQYVFSSKQELKDAVDMYVNYPTIGLDMYGQISTWNVSQVTDMSSLFAGFVSFNEDIIDWDVSNVNDMSNMFNGASSFNQDIGIWDVSNVNDMSNMFNSSSSDFFNNFLSYSGLSAANYSELIKKIAQKYIDGTHNQQSLIFGAENLNYFKFD